MMALLHEYPYLALAQTAFMIWMLVDAYTRRVDTIWLWIILIVPGIGAWAYFFAVKVRDFRRGSLPAIFHRNPSLDELRYRAEQVPTVASHLELAERVVEKGLYDEAITHLEAARKCEPKHKRILYLLAESYAAAGKPAAALPLLEDLKQSDPRWGNYAVWRLLIEARAQSGDKAGALETCRELVKLAPTLEHVCLLAEHLIDQGFCEDARKLLDGALQEYRYASGPGRRLSRGWLRQARRLRKRALPPPT
jgi:hypothetical protein